MTPVGFEPTIAAGERPKTYALDRAATGIGDFKITVNKYVHQIIIKSQQAVQYSMLLQSAKSKD